MDTMAAVQIAKLSLEPGDTIIAHVRPRADDQCDMKTRIKYVTDALESAVANAGLAGQVMILVGDGSVELSILRKNAA